MFYALSLLRNLHGAGGLFSAFIALLGLALSLWMAFDCWKRGGDPYWIWLILGTGASSPRSISSPNTGVAAALNTTSGDASRLAGGFESCVCGRRN
jgi:hypothetical protein